MFYAFSLKTWWHMLNRKLLSDTKMIDTRINLSNSWIANLKMGHIFEEDFLKSLSPEFFQVKSTVLLSSRCF